MAKAQVKKKNEITKVNDIKINKISAFFRRPILKSILKILTMEHGGFRNFKSVKNINRLFANIDMNKYKGNPELEAYIWCISYMSKQWLDGIVSPELAFEIMKRDPDFNGIKSDIMVGSFKDPNIVTAPEAKGLFDLISEALTFGYVASLKDEYINLLDDIDMSEPGSFKKIVERLFLVSQSLLDIKHNTNMVAGKVQFNTADPDSMKLAISSTIDSLSSNSNIFKTGIRRLNTLLSPGYMNGRLYIYAGLPGAGKSLILLKTVLDIRKYNKNFKTRTPGMKPCVLYITMENTFTETIERIWNMTFDEPMTNFSEDEAVDMISRELGITKVLKDDIVVKDQDTGKTELAELLASDPEDEESNIEIVMQYYPYRSINTDDLFTIIQDLRDENLEVCAFVFDYIKRIEPSTPIPDNTKLELDRVSNELKALAVIQDIPVITAHQMNRAAASVVDQAAKSGKADTGKLAGREYLGDSWDVYQVADWLASVNREYKPGTDEQYMTINVLKRRRIDASEAEFAKFTYLAHPFAKQNGLRLVDDINLDKVLSLQSLASDIDIVGIGKEKTNATKRLQLMPQQDFDENY